MPNLTLSERLELQHQYAIELKSYSDSTPQKVFDNTLAALMRDCKNHNDDNFADGVIAYLFHGDFNHAETPRLINLHQAEKIAAVLSDCAHTSYFLPFVLSLKLSDQVLVNHLNSSQAYPRRQYIFDSCIADLSNPGTKDGGYGFCYSCEAGYMFYLQKEEIRDVLTMLKSVDDQVKCAQGKKRFGVFAESNSPLPLYQHNTCQNSRGAC